MRADFTASGVEYAGPFNVPIMDEFQTDSCIWGLMDIKFRIFNWFPKYRTSTLSVWQGCSQLHLLLSNENVKSPAELKQAEFIVNS